MISAQKYIAGGLAHLFGSAGKKWLQFLALFFLLTMIANNIGLAQSADVKPEMKFQQIHEGLISNQVSAIYQDNLGYMWIGTYSGLHRYDGIEFHIYSAGSDTNSISDNYIGEIYEDSHNNLWIGTGRGVVKYNRETDDFDRFELPTDILTGSGESTLVNTITEDNNNILWVSASGKGLYYFDRVNREFIQHQTLANISVNSITVDEQNILWAAAAERGLAKLNTETDDITYFQNVASAQETIASNNISQVKIDSTGTLWIGTSNDGLDRMEIVEGDTIFHHYRHQQGNPNSLGNNSIFTLHVDKTGNLWVGNENGGLHLYNRESDNFYRYDSYPNDPYSLSHNSIWSIYQDDQGRYWIGTAQAGLNVADDNHSKFAHYYRTSGSANSLNNDIIRDFWVDDDNNIWIATDGGGLNYFDRNSGNFSAFQHNPNDPQSLGSNAVIALNRDEQGDLWVGTWGGGLNILTDETNGIFTSFQDRINNYDYSIQNVFGVQFDDRYIWVSSFEEGLFKYDKQTDELELFRSDPGNPSTLTTNFVLTIFQDSNKNMWAATLEGLNLLRADDIEEGIFQQFLHVPDDSSTIAGNSIRQIFEDSKNNIWIAADGGLSKYVEEENSFENYYQSDGLPVNEIRSIIEDDNGNLWIGTVKGLSRFNPENNSFTNFDKSDGLQSYEFSRYSVHKTPNGELLFGGLSGFNLFHPDDIQNNPHIPPVYLTDFKLFSRSVDIRDPESPLEKHISVTDTLVLSYNQDVITFDFIALNYTRPEHNQYAYMVEGFEDDWNYVGTQRNATYTNLDPGEYTFRVKASNNDGIWNEAGASLTLFITPPFWQTAWFYLLSALFIIGAVVSVYRYRVRSIQERNRQLEQQVAQRTEELREKNRDLEATLNELEATKDELVEKAHKAGMADIATGVLHNVGNVLTSVNTSASLIEDMVRQSKLKGLVQANNLLRQKLDQIEEFIANDPKGKNLLEYYLKLEGPLQAEQQKMITQSQRLLDKIKLINEIIAAQQSYAGTGINAESISLNDVIENALALQAGSIERHGLHIEKDLQPTQDIFAQRSKLIHVLVNILKNAKEAMDGMDPNEKKITIKTWQDSEQVYLSIMDSGRGIEDQNRDKIFTQGFTTKKNGHGFGLHSSANYMAEMDGNIKLNHNGKVKGAEFIISLPLNSDIQITENKR